MSWAHSWKRHWIHEVVTNHGSKLNIFLAFGNLSIKVDRLIIYIKIDRIYLNKRYNKKDIIKDIFKYN